MLHSVGFCLILSKQMTFCFYGHGNLPSTWLCCIQQGLIILGSWKEVYSGLLPKPLVWVHGHQRQHDWDRYPHLGLTQTSLISSYWSCRGPETSLQWACVLINCILWMLGQTPQSLHRTGPIGKSLLFTCGCPGFWRPLCFCSCLETSPGRTLKLHRHWHSFFSH